MLNISSRICLPTYTPDLILNVILQPSYTPDLIYSCTACQVYGWHWGNLAKERKRGAAKAPAEESRCKALTGQGHQCLLKAKKGSIWCGNHAKAHAPVKAEPVKAEPSAEPPIGLQMVEADGGQELVLLTSGLDIDMFYVPVQLELLPKLSGFWASAATATMKIYNTSLVTCSCSFSHGENLYQWTLSSTSKPFEGPLAQTSASLWRGTAPSPMPSKLQGSIRLPNPRQWKLWEVAKLACWILSNLDKVGGARAEVRDTRAASLEEAFDGSFKQLSILWSLVGNLIQVKKIPVADFRSFIRAELKGAIEGHTFCGMRDTGPSPEQQEAFDQKSQAMGHFGGQHWYDLRPVCSVDYRRGYMPRGISSAKKEEPPFYSSQNTKKYSGQNTKKHCCCPFWTWVCSAWICCSWFRWKGKGRRGCRKKRSKQRAMSLELPQQWRRRKLPWSWL